MYMYMVVLLLINFVLCVDRKRLLLNDMDIGEKFHQMELEIQRLKNQISEVPKGVVYTRWGRTTCPGNGTELVYSGIAGGGHYTHNGAAAEYICLPHGPNLITNTAPQNPWGHFALLYGGEYEDNFFGPNLQENDAPCAVCFAPRSSVSLMIPGKTTCQSGWKLEYFGKLASGGYTQNAPSQYVCLDNKPEVLEHGSASENGKLFYAVKTVCGSLPCPPYTNNALMTCVVCSR